MQPHIQYTKTADGVSIAYAAEGAGPPVVFVSSLFGSLHMANQATADTRYPVEKVISLGWKVITYDRRGAGSSDRDCDDFSVEVGLRDLQAVIDREAPEEPCTVVGTLNAGPIAIAYAAANPERVSHLVLRNAFASGVDRHEAMLGMLVARVLRPIAEEHWEFYTLTLANALGGYADSERARREAEAYRSAISPQGYLAATEATDRIDVSDMLDSIRVPTLVVNDTGYLSVGVGWGPTARKLASRIPNARLVVTDDFPRALDEFLRKDSNLEMLKTSAQSPSGTAIILFADIANSTALTERLGDAAFREKARELDDALRRCISANGGTAVDGKLLGDGVLATFGAAREAIACALACERAAAATELGLHIGLHAGDVIREQDNVYGGAVNIASRISELAAPGEVLVSRTVADLARTSAGVSFEDRGDHELKGIDGPVRIFALRGAS